MIEGSHRNAGFNGGRGNVRVTKVDIGPLDPREGVKHSTSLGKMKRRRIQHRRQSLRCRTTIHLVGGLEGVENLRDSHGSDLKDCLAAVGILNESRGARRMIPMIVPQESQQDIGVQLVDGDIAHGQFLRWALFPIATRAACFSPGS